MNLEHVIKIYNIKNCLVDSYSSKVLSGKKLNVDQIPTGNSVVLDLLLDGSLKQKYDLILINDNSLGVMKDLFHKSLFIFITSNNDTGNTDDYKFLSRFYQEVKVIGGRMYRNDFLSITKLSLNEQVNIRDKPFRFLKKVTELLNETPSKKKTVIEIGSVRNKLTHDLEEIHPNCCNDSHSTYFLCEIEKAKIHTVDINPLCKYHLESNLPKMATNSKLHIYTNDGLDFLTDYASKKVSKIDLLFLDSWDVGTNNYAENHLEAYEIIKCKLNENCIIVIDDTDVGFEGSVFGGKGKLLIPVLLRDKFTIVYSGRHTVLF
jgi:hypothetical protein